VARKRRKRRRREKIKARAFARVTEEGRVRIESGQVQQRLRK